MFLDLIGLVDFFLVARNVGLRPKKNHKGVPGGRLDKTEGSQANTISLFVGHVGSCYGKFMEKIRPKAP